MSEVRARFALASAIAAAVTGWAAPADAHLSVTEGDVAIVAIYTGPGDAEVSFQFVTLRDFHPGEALGFTDRGWLMGSDFRVGSREGEKRWVPAASVRGGTVVFLPAHSDLDLERGADQVFAFDGTISDDGTFAGLLVHGVNLGGDWAVDATSSTTSAQPRELVDASVALGAFENCAYDGPTVGTKAELLALIGDAGNWICSDTEQPSPPGRFTVYADLGDFCEEDGDCAVGFCVNRVCCDSECGRGEAGHCRECNFGPMDLRSGFCQAAPSTYLCRVSRGPCDPAEHCDGELEACPADELHTASAVCRASAGACDPPETCSGDSAACPPDVRTDPGSCDDGDACTADGCTADATCIHAPIEGCCDDDADCDDEDPCTVDTCAGDRCTHGPILMCDADAGADAGRVIPPVGSVGGGGCSAAGAPAPLGWALLLLLVAALRGKRQKA